MKVKMFFMLLFLGVGVVAQEITIEIEDFNEVIVDSGLKVNFIQSEENKAVISGPQMEEVRISSKNGKLLISSKLRKIIGENRATVNLYYNNLKKIEATQNSEVELCGIIEQPEITLVVKEGAKLLAELKVDILNANASTGGNLNLSGKAGRQDIEVRAKGNFRGETLVAENIKIIVKGGGTANVNATLLVDAKVEAGGEVYILGDPEKIVKNSGIAGTIQKIN